MKPLFMKTLFTGFGIAMCLSFSQQSQARYETCYEQEYRCETRYENECRNEQVCHTVPGQQQCHQVRLCTPRPSSPNCQQVTECGTNALGQQICKTREVCNGVTGGGEDCGYVQQCDNTPSRQECNYEQRCDSVPRQDCRYETVQKSCYVPDPIPEPQPQPQPWPVHPTPVEPQPQPQPWPIDPPTPVEPQPQPWPVDPTPVEPSPIEPAPVDPSIPAEMGEKTISGLQMKIDKSKVATVIFADKGQSFAYRTQYFITVLDHSGVVIVNQHASGSGQVQQAIELTNDLSPREDHTLVIRVLRSGGSIVKDVSFIKTISVPARQ
jgi:hypothetical protein